MGTNREERRRRHDRACNAVLLPLLRRRGPASRTRTTWRMALRGVPAGVRGEVRRLGRYGGCPMSTITRAEELRIIVDAASVELAQATAQEALEWTARTFGQRWIVASNMQDALLVD